MAPAQQRPGLAPAQLKPAKAQDGPSLRWIGAQDGLLRYDGDGDKVFHPRRGDPHCCRRRSAGGWSTAIRYNAA